MTTHTHLQAPSWMDDRATRAVVTALGGEVRFVGGCVRNTLLGRPVDDIDLATPLQPPEVMRLLQAAGLKAVPTGIDHGTVTAIAFGRPFEITTLRRDIATDGRHAVVAFSRDWAEDAQRRDFTINALYADLAGTVYDYASGLDDLKAGRIRFMGDAAARIGEDGLRILRLFRFFAWYGSGAPDGDALAAAAAGRAGLQRLSGERIAKEMLKLLSAEAPMASLRLMAELGILDEIAPAAANFARAERLIAIENSNFFAPDPQLRLAALLPGDGGAARALAARWKLANAARDRLIDLAAGREPIVSYLSIHEVRRWLYRLGPQRFSDRVKLRWAEDGKPANAPHWRTLLALAQSWQRPRFPLTGRDVMQAGVAEGPQVGRVLGAVEAWWIDADFSDDPLALAERLKAVAQALS